MNLFKILINNRIIVFLLYFKLFKYIFKKLKFDYLVKSKIFGNFFIYLPRHLNYLFKQKYENNTINFIKTKLDNYNTKSYFIDVGANIGIYSLYFKKKYSSKVELFEPDINNINLLKKTKSINKFKFFKINSFCLSDSNSNKEFLLDDIRGMTGTLSNDRNFIQKHQKLKKKISVKTKKFDSIYSFKNKIFLIKIDVEGHEIEVFKGMLKAIKHNKPMLIIESNKNNIKYIKKKLVTFGYKYKFISKDLNYIFYQ